jgi:ATP-binding cassette subfamily B protein
MPTSKKSPFQVLLTTLPWLRDYRYRIAFILLLLITVNFLTVAMPVVFKEIIDSFDTTKNTILILPLGLLLIYGGLQVSQALLLALRRIFIIPLNNEIQRRLSINVFDHIHQLSLRYHLERKTGGVIADMQRGSMAVMTLISSLLFLILPMAFEFIFAIALLISQYTLHLTLAVLGTIAVFGVYMYFASQWFLDTRKLLNEQSSEKSNVASDSLLNYETVKYFNNEYRESTTYNTAWKKWGELSVKFHRSLLLIFLGQQIIIAFGVTIILIISSQGVVAKEMSIGDLVLINALFIQLTAPMASLGIQVRNFKDSLIDMKQVVDLLNTTPEVQDPKDAQPLVLKNTDICFKNVNFSYDEQRTILHDFSLTLPANKTIAIVGKSGAGKSTLTRLLFRFYDVQDGSIQIGGQDIRHVTQNSLRQAMAIVPQDSILFNNTITFNLAYGKPDASQEDIESAAKMAQIYDFIESLPEKWDTKVGERGLKLSGGEKQRVAIARAILKQPKILLLDEATSSLDSKTEKAIQSTLEEIAGHYTTLIIAHRLSSIVHADLIVVMEQGRIVEQGSHQELLQRKGLYAEMWQVQQS